MADVTVLDYRQGGTGIGIGRICTEDNTIQTDKTLQIYAGRDGNSGIGADLIFCDVSNEKQRIGWCGGVPSSNHLLILNRFTSSDSGSAGVLMEIDKWNNCYHNFGLNYFANPIRFYGSHTAEAQIKYDGSDCYLYLHNPSNNSHDIGLYHSGVGSAWHYNASSQQLQLKSGYGTTSDKRLKCDFNEFENWDDYYSFYMSLKPLTFKYNDDSREETHMGMKAQDVESSIIENNLDNENLCLVKYHENKEMDDNREYTLAYQELISLNIKMIQKQEKEIQELKEIINQQQEFINSLLNE